MTENISGRRIEVAGIVQGVGFRPFVHRLVKELGLRGWVRNTNFGAELELVGQEESIEAFLSKLQNNPPSLALIEFIKSEKLSEIPNYEGFEIHSSIKSDSITALVSPDTCTCDDCLSELFSSSDRRHDFPFINCTNCGPRFTIIKSLPYDRQYTSMSEFPMCDKCLSEFSDIENRRYHAQPNCCHDCGPAIWYKSADCSEINSHEPILKAVSDLKAGKIVAIKGLGGFHLACNLKSETVIRLRERKHRDEKPFALMCRDIETAKKYCIISEAEAKLLKSPARPIVLLRKKDKAKYMHISENSSIGVMLPYTPIQFLIFAAENEIDSLIMTSANLSDTPIVHKNEEAEKKLSGIADTLLLHNREILTICDDSVLREYGGREYFLRRSRGYVPHPIITEKSVNQILACGVEQKASFCLSKGNHLFQSQHIGDLKNIETLNCYAEQIEHFESIFEIKPRLLACDMHPDYLSSDYAAKRAKQDNIPLYKVYHHHAHLASCMADNGIVEDCLGLIWDGSGYGEDGNAWGSELLIGGYRDFKRLAGIRQISMPGGDKAVKGIWRLGLSMLNEIGSAIEFSDVSEFEQSAVSALLNSSSRLNKCSGMGRLFDGVAALLNIKSNCSYEGQGAILLESLSHDTDDEYASDIYEENGIMLFDWRQMTREIIKDKAEGKSTGIIASKFMNTVISVAEKQCKIAANLSGIKNVCLSGGVFQNMYLMSKLPKRLSDIGLNVITHRRVSTNDEGISLGQLMIAEARYVSGSAT